MCRRGARRATVLRSRLREYCRPISSASREQPRGEGGPMNRLVMDPWIAKNPGPFRVGDRVSYPMPGYRQEGVIIEDRGNLGKGGIRIYGPTSDGTNRTKSIRRYRPIFWNWSKLLRSTAARKRKR